MGSWNRVNQECRGTAGWMRNFQGRRNMGGKFSNKDGFSLGVDPFIEVMQWCIADAYQYQKLSQQD